MRANFIFSEVWIGLRRNLTMTIAVVVTVAVGMALLGIGLMINSQVGRLSSYWNDQVEVNVYLCKAKDDPFPKCRDHPALSDEQKAALKGEIQGMQQVESVTFVDASQAYKIFIAGTADTVLKSAVKVGDLPESFQIKLRDPNNYATTVQTLESTAGVSNVINQKDLVDKTFGFLGKLQWSALVIALTMVFAAALLIGNTVRLSAYNRRRETGIMRLVGASNLYIQLPFIMEGTIAGLIGGVFAAVLLICSKIIIFDGLGGLMSVQLSWNAVSGVITLTMIVGVLICILASFITLRRYLRV
ncbi:permease-like cell division protein FtsX [Streptosporangiaceae bacterium NEAU-GS5]|nr:permease-like cell division protein FtsX [Streptosporangiaceae bacterium NEAU-GS5]